jgi:hypothetical protein
MKTFFNQYQTPNLFSCRGNSSDTDNSLDQHNEEAIAEHIKVIAKASSQPQPQSANLTDIMNYYLSVAG